MSATPLLDDDGLPCLWNKIQTPAVAPKALPTSFSILPLTTPQLLLHQSLMPWLPWPHNCPSTRQQFMGLDASQSSVSGPNDREIWPDGTTPMWSSTPFLITNSAFFYLRLPTHSIQVQVVICIHQLLYSFTLFRLWNIRLWRQAKTLLCSLLLKIFQWFTLKVSKAHVLH